LIQRQKRASDLLLLAEELLVERVNVWRAPDRSTGVFVFAHGT